MKKCGLEIGETQMTNLEDEIQRVIIGLVCALNQDRKPHAVPLIDLTVKAILLKIRQHQKEQQ